MHVCRPGRAAAASLLRMAQDPPPSKGTEVRKAHAPMLLRAQVAVRFWQPSIPRTAPRMCLSASGNMQCCHLFPHALLDVCARVEMDKWTGGELGFTEKPHSSVDVGFTWPASCARHQRNTGLSLP